MGISERVCDGLKSVICTAEDAAAMISSGMTLGFSGFALVGYPKAVPKAIARTGVKNLTVIASASGGDELDGELTRAGCIKIRYPYQSNADMRKQINSGNLGYVDMHLSHLPTFINQQKVHMDYAVIECVAVDENGLYPAASVGASDAIVRNADKIILEVNCSLPMDMIGMHDVFEIGLPPNARPIPIIRPYDRIGTPYIPCPKDKIAAVIMTDGFDQAPKFRPPDAISEKIAEYVIEFLKSEIAAGRLPEELGPIQSGVGAVANAVLIGLSKSDFKGLNMFTETFQDSALRLIEDGTFSTASTCCISLSEEAQQHFFKNIEKYKDRIIIRGQEISNHCEVIRRLGIISLNTPVEVDIYGNVNSTHIMGSSVVNGIGGSGDFARNARLNIFATGSLAKNGAVSCVVPMVSHVDHTEHDTQVFITEYGIADLRWKTPVERAEAIIENCAHPDFRPQLRAYLKQAQRISYGKHIPLDFENAFKMHKSFMKDGSMKEQFASVNA